MKLIKGIFGDKILIFKNMGNYYQVEMFHVVNISKDHPAEAFNEYLVKLAHEFNKQLTSTQFSIQHNLPFVDVTDSHKVVEDVA